VIIGPSLGARYVPGALIGLPLVSAVLSPLGAAAVQQWQSTRIQAGATGPMIDLLSLTFVQFVVGWLIFWVLFALWALVPLLAVHQVMLLDADAGTLTLRKGPRTIGRRPLDQVVAAVGDPTRDGMALVAFEEGEDWIIPAIGWDNRSFEGLRELQRECRLPLYAPRRELMIEHRRAMHEAANRQMAERIGMPWREEYAHDEEAFLAEFDHRRRVLGGKEEARADEQ
jgi:hypothetical protein